MSRLLFLTGNAGKLVEATQFFAPLGYQVEQFLIDGEVPPVTEPQSDELRHVTLSKIEQATEYLDANGHKAAILVEDSGLFIDELNGFPGVYSASILEQLGLSGILKIMSGMNERGAEFRTCAALWNGERVIFGEGICRGTITEDIQGGEGFGYDPIFSPEGADTARTFGDMSGTEKRRFSHRERALKSLKNQLG